MKVSKKIWVIMLAIFLLPAMLLGLVFRANKLAYLFSRGVSMEIWEII